MISYLANGNIIYNKKKIEHFNNFNFNKKLYEGVDDDFMENPTIPEDDNDDPETPVTDEEVPNCDSQIEEKQNEISELQNNYNTIQTNYQTLQGNYDTIQTNLINKQTEISELQDNLVTKHNELSISQTNLINKQTEISECQTNYNKCQTDFTNKQNEFDSLKQLKTSELENIRSQFTASEEDFLKCQGELINTKTELTTAKFNSDDYKVKLEDKTNELNTSNSRISSLETQLYDFDLTKTELNTCNTNLVEKNNQITSLQINFDNSQLDLTDERNNHNNTQNDYETCQSNLVTKKLDLDKLQNNFNSKVNELNINNSEYETLQNNFAKEKEDHITTNGLLNSKNTEFDNYKNTCNGIKSEFENEQNLHNNTKSNLLDEQNSHSATQTAHDKAIEEFNKKKIEIDVLLQQKNAKIDLLQQTLDEYEIQKKNDIQNAKNEFTKQQEDEMINHINILNNVREQLNFCNTKNEDVDQRISNLIMGNCKEEEQQRIKQSENKNIDIMAELDRTKEQLKKVKYDNMLLDDKLKNQSCIDEKLKIRQLELNLVNTKKKEKGGGCIIC